MKYILEFIGVTTILYAKFLTHANPYIMGLVYFAMFLITQPYELTGFFSPLSATMTYMLGRTTLQDTLVNIAVQCAALICVVISFKPMADFLM